VTLFPLQAGKSFCSLIRLSWGREITLSASGGSEAGDSAPSCNGKAPVTFSDGGLIVCIFPR
jgi:hypothetical protein